MRILEEFWYGNIEPTEYDTSSCKEYKKLLELICRNEEKLQATMTDEQKELFSRYTDAVREHQMTTDCLIFQNGFIYGLQPTDRIFPYDKSYMGRQMKFGCEKAGIQKIRVHGVRHTHATLLIDIGCTPLLVAERLGHEKVQTTLDTYAHLYPNKQNEVAAQLNEFMVKDDGYEKTS